MEHLRGEEYVGFIWNSRTARDFSLVDNYLLRVGTGTDGNASGPAQAKNELQIRVKNGKPFIVIRNSADADTTLNAATGRKEMTIQMSGTYEEQTGQDKWKGALIVGEGESVEADWDGDGEFLKFSNTGGDGFIANYFALLAGADKTTEGARIFRLEVGAHSIEIGVVDGYAELRENGRKVGGLNAPRIFVGAGAAPETLNLAFGVIREEAKLRLYFSINGSQLTSNGAALDADYDFTGGVRFFGYRAPAAANKALATNIFAAIVGGLSKSQVRDSVFGLSRVVSGAATGLAPYQWLDIFRTDFSDEEDARKYADELIIGLDSTEAEEYINFPPADGAERDNFLARELIECRAILPELFANPNLVGEQGANAPRVIEEIVFRCDQSGHFRVEFYDEDGGVDGEVVPEAPTFTSRGAPVGPPCLENPPADEPPARPLLNGKIRVVNPTKLPYSPDHNGDGRSWGLIHKDNTPLRVFNAEVAARFKQVALGDGTRGIIPVADKK